MQARRPRRAALMWGAASVALAAAGAQLGAIHWAGDILALVSDTILWAGLALAVACAVARAWRWSLLAGVAALLCGGQIAGYAQREPEPIPAPRDLRLMVYNIYFQNPDLAGVVAEIRRHDPDIVLLMEYSDAIQREIEGEFDDYPYRLIRPSRMTMGLALFSRVPIEGSEVHRAEATRIPVYEVRMRAGGRAFTLVGGHPWPPQPQWGELHRRQMGEIARVAAGAAGPLIVAGDFNAAPWSHTMQDLARGAGVRHVRGRLDLTKTWQLLPLVGLPIDHVLVSDAWRVLSYSYGDPAGSDHVPLIIDLQLP